MDSEPSELQRLPSIILLAPYRNLNGPTDSAEEANLLGISISRWLEKQAKSQPGRGAGSLQTVWGTLTQVLRFGDRARQWEIYMHEVIGHGSGKPAASLKVDPAVAIGRAYSALEECRADLVALYHVFDPKLVEIGAFSANEQNEIAHAMYIGYLQGQMNRYRMYEDDRVREAHQRGHQLILGFLIHGGRNGDQGYGVQVTQQNGNYYVQLGDLKKAHRGVADLLRTLQLIKAQGDGAAATELFDRFGTRVNPEWRHNVRARATRLKIPNKWAFVFPRLEPVMHGDAVADVRLHVDEDLTAQQLRFSRLRFNKRVPE